MASIIDKLIVLVGLDSKEFDRGAKHVEEGLSRTTKHAEKTGKEISAGAEKAGEFFHHLKKEVTELYLAIAGTEAVKQSFEAWISGGSALKNLTDQIGGSIKDLSTWEIAANMAGYEGKALTDTWKKIAQSFQDYQLHPERIYPMLEIFSKLGVDLRNPANLTEPKKQSQAILEFADAWRKLGYTRTFVAGALRNAGVSESIIPFLLKERKELEKYFAEAEKRTPFDENSAKRAHDIEAKINAVKEAVKGLQNTFWEKWGEDIEGFLKKLDKVIMSFSALPERIKGPIVDATMILGALALPLIMLTGPMGFLAAASSLAGWAFLRINNAGKDTQAIFGFIREKLEALKPVLLGAGKWFSDLLKNNPEIIERLSLVTGAFIALKVALWGLSIAGAAAGAALWPLLAFAAAFKLINDNWEGIKGFFQEFGKAFDENIGGLDTEGANKAVKPLIDAIKWLRDIVTGKWDLGEERWRSWGKMLGGETANAVKNLARAINAVADAIDRLSGKELPAVKPMTLEEYDAHTQRGLEELKDNPAARERLQRRREAGRQAIAASPGSFEHYPGARGESAEDTQSEIDRRKREASSSIGGGTSSGTALGGIRRILGFAEGTPATPIDRPFAVGERGPEIMQFGSSARVTPLADVVNTDEINGALYALNASMSRVASILGSQTATTSLMLGRIRLVLDEIKDQIETVVVPILNNSADSLGRLVDIFAPPMATGEESKAPGAAGDEGPAYKGGGRPMAISAKEVQERYKDDIDFFMGRGWTKEQAIGIVTNMAAESGSWGKNDYKAVGDGGLAFGLAQWHPDRQKNFQRFYREKYGKEKNIKESTRNEQREFIDWELRNTEKAAGDRLRRSATSPESAAVVSKYFERPAAVEEAARNRGALARVIERLIQRMDEAARMEKDKQDSGKSQGEGRAPAAYDALNTKPVTEMAAVRASNDNRVSTTVNHNNVQTNIGTVTTAATDANSLTNNLKPYMARLYDAAQSDYGVA